MLGNYKLMLASEKDLSFSEWLMRAILDTVLQWKYLYLCHYPSNENHHFENHVLDVNLSIR